MSAQTLKVAVVGGGTMGSGIALLARNQGFPVELVSVRSLESGDAAAEQAVSSAALVLEYGPEDFDRKEEILRRISELNPNGAIATGTSSIRLSALAPAVANSSRFLGVHFINPPLLQSTVELISRAENPPPMIAAVQDWLRALNRVVFLVPDTPGFVVNATLFPYLNHAAYVLDQTGVSVSELDSMMKSVLGAPMGPLAILDFVGLDVAAAILENLNREDPSTNLPVAPAILQRVAANQLGKKTQGGFY